MSAGPPIVPRFPSVRWDPPGAAVTFVPSSDLALSDAAAAVVVFALEGDSFLLADISGRGWCTPSGRVEAGESAPEAAVRETLEETGAVLDRPRLLGRYIFRYDNGRESRVPAFAGRVNQRRALASDGDARSAASFARSDLPAVYYRWDPLLARVFEYAAQRLSEE